MEKPPTIYTIGHSNVPLSTMVRELRKNNIDTVIDVRSRGYSHFEHFNRHHLKESLPSAGIQYSFRGHNMGGKDENIYYYDSIKELEQRVRNGENIAIMCSEGDYRKCHRYEMLTPDLSGLGLRVEHIRYGDFPIADGGNEVLL